VILSPDNFILLSVFTLTDMLNNSPAIDYAKS
jgi:hypothetical protein